MTRFTVRYGDGPEQLADIRLPAGDPTGPLVIFIHGGFWKAAYDRHHAAPLAVDLAGRGYPVASIEYRRVGQPGGGWPGTFDDVAAAVARVPGLVGADTGRPILAGHSAGGHLALWAAARADGVGGTLALAPVADLALGYRLGLGDGAVAALLGGGPSDVPDRYAYGDPGRSPVPTVIVHGTADDVVPVELARAYVRRCPTAELVELPGVDHMAVIDPESAAWPAVVRALAAIRT